MASFEGVFSRIFSKPVEDNGSAERPMIDAGRLKAHRRAAGSLKKGALPRPIGRAKGGSNTRPHQTRSRMLFAMALDDRFCRRRRKAGRVTVKERGVRRRLSKGRETVGR
jgi:hypothetical protein